ncbi:hypothetical protein RGQ21_68310 [Kitasatospora aureofaciens]|nr:hypothetical protein RGQ21_68310 [Kitasatospora aureofaciens]
MDSIRNRVPEKSNRTAVMPRILGGDDDIGGDGRRATSGAGAVGVVTRPGGTPLRSRMPAPVHQHR